MSRYRWRRHDAMAAVRFSFARFLDSTIGIARRVATRSYGRRNAISPRLASYKIPYVISACTYVVLNRATGDVRAHVAVGYRVEHRRKKKREEKREKKGGKNNNTSIVPASGDELMLSPLARSSCVRVSLSFAVYAPLVAISGQSNDDAPRKRLSPESTF